MKKTFAFLLIITIYNFALAQYDLQDYYIPELQLKIKFYKGAKKVNLQNGYKYEFSYYNNSLLQLGAALIIDTSLKCGMPIQFEEFIQKKRNEYKECTYYSYYFRDLGTYDIVLSCKTAYGREYYKIFPCLQGTLTVNIVCNESEINKNKHLEIQNSLVKDEIWKSFTSHRIELRISGRLQVDVFPADREFLVIYECGAAIKDFDMIALLRVIRLTNEQLNNIDGIIDLRIKEIEQNPNNKKVIKWNNNALNKITEKIKNYGNSSVMIEYIEKPDLKKSLENLVREYYLIKGNDVIQFKVYFPFLDGYENATTEENEYIGEFDKHLIELVINNIKILEP